jgi:hypothetical protein
LGSSTPSTARAMILPVTLPMPSSRHGGATGMVHGNTSAASSTNVAAHSVPASGPVVHRQLSHAPPSLSRQGQGHAMVGSLSGVVAPLAAWTPASPPAQLQAPMVAPRGQALGHVVVAPHPPPSLQLFGGGVTRNAGNGGVVVAPRRGAT